LLNYILNTSFVVEEPCWKRRRRVIDKHFVIHIEIPFVKHLLQPFSIAVVRFVSLVKFIRMPLAPNGSLSIISFRIICYADPHWILLSLLKNHLVISTSLNIFCNIIRNFFPYSLLLCRFTLHIWITTFRRTQRVAFWKPSFCMFVSFVSQLQFPFDVEETFVSLDYFCIITGVCGPIVPFEKSIVEFIVLTLWIIL
jgi:hypothetical protein